MWLSSDGEARVVNKQFFLIRVLLINEHYFDFRFLDQAPYLQNLKILELEMKMTTGDKHKNY